jgi:quinolinate synthase
MIFRHLGAISLIDPYIIFDDDLLKEKIRDELTKRNGILLAHNYQRDEIQEIADYRGDSFGLSREAAITDADLIIFCGVHFMAETASILSPTKKVLLPRMEAGCPMADMVDVGDLRKLKEQHPGAAVVCYVNTSAAVKAESDICCTSANAVEVVNSLDGVDKVIFVPDMNLGKFVAMSTDKEIILWNGFCPTHHRLSAEEVQCVLKAHPRAKFVAHPECRPEVLKLADHICSTSGMYKYACEVDARELIIGTEIGVIYRLKLENNGKRFYKPSNDMICPNMKLITLQDVLYSLLHKVYGVTVPEEIRERAKKAIDGMLAVPRER